MQKKKNQRLRQKNLTNTVIFIITSMLFLYLLRISPEPWIKNKKKTTTNKANNGTK